MAALRIETGPTTVLFQSVARRYGRAALGVPLTGMSDDGAAGLKAIHDCGGLTLAQGAAASAVYGMPRVAVDLGAVDHVIAPPALAGRLADGVGGAN